jgi:uncharacterized protein involved in exopolysaccharide biosynthesis
MTEGTSTTADDEISLFAMGNTIVRNRWRILRWAFVGGFIAAISVINAPFLYSASASFIPQGNDASRSGLAGLAGQLGVSVPGSNQSLSPEFYVKLLESRVLLQPITHDSFTVAEKGGRKIAFMDMFGIKGGTTTSREEDGVRLLQSIVAPTQVPTTGVVEISVVTPWRSVSLAIVTALVNGVNEYNQATRQGQAAAERKFVEGRLAVASADLRASEDRLEQFLRTNRDLGGSPELTLERDRIQREVTLKQGVFTALTQAYEDVRIREVRDTPVISMFETPWAPTDPAPRGRIKKAEMGILLGSLFGVLVSFLSATFARRRAEGDVHAEEFLAFTDKLSAEGRMVLQRLRLRKVG